MAFSYPLHSFISLSLSFSATTPLFLTITRAKSRRIHTHTHTHLFNIIYIILITCAYYYESYQSVLLKRVGLGPPALPRSHHNQLHVVSFLFIFFLFLFLLFFPSPVIPQTLVDFVFLLFFPDVIRLRRSLSVARSAVVHFSDVFNVPEKTM